MPALIINRIAYEDTCMVVWNLCLRFFRLRAKDRYEGDIRNMPDTVRFFCAEMKGNGMDVRPEDQEKMVNGKFKFTREADRTTKMYISLNNTGYTVWVKPGANIKITGEAPYVQNWLAESDIPIPEQVELNRFREATR